MNEKKNSLIATVSAAKELRKVPGFDPLKYLRTVSQNGEKVLKLDLRYKKLWFRLACPHGRMLLNPLRITDQMAIFEARVYASKDDTTPLASFTSTQKAHDIPGGLYIRAAQDEALNEALDNAGFGIQLCDVAQVSDGSGFGSEIPLSQVEAAMQMATTTGTPVSEPTAELPEKAAATAKMAAESTQTPKPIAASSAPIPQEPAEDHVESEVSANQPTAENLEPASAEEESTPAAEKPAPTEEPVPAAEEPAPLAEMSGADAIPEADDVNSPLVVSLSETAEAVEDTPPTDGTPVQSGYTEDMTVEEICQRMTLEEAENILVPLGTCKGWTLGQVLDRRATSLRWYMVGCQDASNVLKAGATLLWNHRQMQKAG